MTLVSGTPTRVPRSYGGGDNGKTTPQAEAPRSTDGAVQAQTQEEALPRFWGAIAGALLPLAGKAVSALAPKAGSAIGGLFGNSKLGGKIGSGVGGVLGSLFGSRDLDGLEYDGYRELEEAQLTHVATDCMNEAIPFIIDSLYQQTQERASRGETGSVDDETLERFWGGLVGPLSEVISMTLPSSIKKATQIFGGFMGSRDVETVEPLMVDAEVAQRFFGPVLAGIMSTVQATLPQLVKIIQDEDTDASSRDVSISWQDLETTKRFWDNDNIALLGLTPIEDPEAIEFVLELAPHKSWWKGLEIQDDNGTLVAEIGVEGSRKIAKTRVPAQVLLSPGGYLVFSKAKMFGVRTGMYRLATGGLTQLKGKRAHFFWYAD